MTNQQAPEIYALHTVPNKGERPWSGIYAVRADAEHDAKVLRDATGRDWSVVRLVVADTATTPTGPVARYKIGYHSDERGMRSSTPGGVSDPSGQWVLYKDHIEALRAAHVQNPAEIEHVACDVSKNGAEVNMSSQQTAPAGFVPVAAFDRLYAHAESLAAQLLATPQRDVQEPCGWIYDWTHSSATGKPDTTYTGFTKDEAHARKHDNCIAVFATQQPAPATPQVGEVVAYLDVGANGYLDLGSALSDEALQQSPKGRHALVIAGTYGIDGYVAAPQPSPTAQADSQPAPEYVGNGMFKGETIQKAAEHWANWCDVRCMTGLSEFLRVVAARAPTDSVLEDAARLDWLALAGPVSICVVIDRPHDGEVEVATDDVTGYGKTLREALDAARKQGANHD